MQYPSDAIEGLEPTTGQEAQVGGPKAECLPAPIAGQLVIQESRPVTAMPKLICHLIQPTTRFNIVTQSSDIAQQCPPYAPRLATL